MRNEWIVVYWGDNSRAYIRKSSIDAYGAFGDERSKLIVNGEIIYISESFEELDTKIQG